MIDDYMYIQDSVNSNTVRTRYMCSCITAELFQGGHLPI